MEPIHFFRAGTHVAQDGREITFTEADLRSIATAYDPVVHEAPIVIGHPKTDDPAFGWVQSLEVRADGLWATARQVDGSFADAVRNGSFKKVSGSFYAPRTKGNPKPDGYYLRHIGFLGAAAPAVKGLQPVAFNDDDTGVVNFEAGTIDLREHSLLARERAIARAELEARLTRLASEARIHFRDVPGLLAFAESLDDTSTIGFADTEDGRDVECARKTWFLGFLEKRLPFVTLGEVCKGEDLPGNDASFSAPAGHTVDPAGADLHRRAVAHQKATGVPYAVAARAVERR